MAFTYSNDPASSTRDAIRFYCQDTNVDDPLLQDEEIDFLSAQWAHVTDHPMYLAAVACEAIAARFAREISYSADGISVGASELQNKYNQLATDLREQHKASVIGDGPDISGILVGAELDDTIKPLVWGKGMHDNPEAGRQDYGGDNWRDDWYPERDGTWYSR